MHRFDILTHAVITDITETPITWANWPQHVNWLNTTFIIFIPLVGLVSSYWIDLQFKTAVFAVAYYFFAGLGISTLLPAAPSITCK